MDPTAQIAAAPGAFPDHFSSVPVTLNAEQCAVLLNCSKATVEELAMRGILPATRVGRGWVLVTRQLLAWLENRCATEAAERRAEPVATTGAAIPLDKSADVAVRRPGRPRKPHPSL